MADTSGLLELGAGTGFAINGNTALCTTHQLGPTSMPNGAAKRWDSISPSNPNARLTILQWLSPRFRREHQHVVMWNLNIKHRPVEYLKVKTFRGLMPLDSVFVHGESGSPVIDTRYADETVVGVLHSRPNEYTNTVDISILENMNVQNLYTLFTNFNTPRLRKLILPHLFMSNSQREYGFQFVRVM